MATVSKKRIMCHSCTRVECRLEYPRGIPDYCEANTFPQVLEETKSEYQAPGSVEIYRAAGKVVANGYLKWPRVKEAIEFCKELGVSRVGFASCVALRQELRDLAQLWPPTTALLFFRRTLV